MQTKVKSLCFTALQTLEVPYLSKRTTWLALQVWVLMSIGGATRWFWKLKELTYAAASKLVIVKFFCGSLRK